MAVPRVQSPAVLIALIGDIFLQENLPIYKILVQDLRVVCLYHCVLMSVY